MRKSLLLALTVFLTITIAFSFFLIGCDEDKTTGTNKGGVIISNEEPPNIIVIKEYTDGAYKYRWICDKDTSVMYLMTITPNGNSITPLYNTDSTLRRYTPPP